MRGSLDSVIIFPRTDGSFETVTLLNEGLLPGETDQAFIDRTIKRLCSANQAYIGKRYFIKSKDEIRRLVNASTHRDKRGLSCDMNGNFSMNDSYKSELEIQKEKTELLKSKLKTSLGLTDDEVKTLFVNHL